MAITESKGSQEAMIAALMRLRELAGGGRTISPKTAASVLRPAIESTDGFEILSYYVGTCVMGILPDLEYLAEHAAEDAAAEIERGSR